MRYFFGRVGEAERDDLADWLTPAQLELFDSMHRADQRHGLDVVAALRMDGQTIPTFCLPACCTIAARAANCTSGTGSAGRCPSATVVALERLFLRLPGFRDGVRGHRRPRRAFGGAGRAAGCSAATADLIRHQAEPIDDVLGLALLLADQAN